jgi:DegV family protein with EDD domain
MAKVRIITDVTAYLEPELVARHRITVLPVEIRFGDERFLLAPGDDTKPLFERMAGGMARPTSASIPAGYFEEAYRQLCRQTDDVLVILSSSKLSTAYVAAQAAARAFLGRCRITVLDSMSASWGLGLIVQVASRSADEGHSLDEIVRRVRGMLPHIYSVFFVDRLDYLEVGGRIGIAQALLGTMLRIKPLLLIEEGEIIPMEKVRTRILALEKLASFVAEFAALQEVVILRSPLDGNNGELVDELREQLSLALPDRQFPVIEYDPILACHLGPEALGVVVYEQF